MAEEVYDGYVHKKVLERHHTRRRAGLGIRGTHTKYNFPPQTADIRLQPPHHAMDITGFVAGFREAAFLLGDHDTYHAQVSRRLRIVQKKLGRATPKNAKYTAKAPVTAADIAKDKEYAQSCIGYVRR